MNAFEEVRIVKKQTAAAVAADDGPGAAAVGAHAADRRGRILRDLRISVTDRCNFRCRYCMPSEVYGKDFKFIPHASLLSFEEIVQLARCFVALGVRKIRLTGGEPLLRRNVEQLVSQLAQLRTADGAPVELALTTNGSLLRKKAAALHAAGLQRVTVSLDALDDRIFQQINSVGFSVAGVLDGIDAAMQAGLRPVKVNMVVKRGLNEQEILPMVRHFKRTGVVLRFIEYMDVGTTNGWCMDEVVPSAQVIAAIRQEFPLEAAQPTAPGETAQRWRHADGSGEIGVISSVTQAFCGDCNRLRLSTEGTLYTCLFASAGHDLRTLLRKGAEDAALTNAIRTIWQNRDDRYSELRALGQASNARRGEHTLHRVEMGYIGG